MRWQSARASSMVAAGIILQAATISGHSLPTIITCVFSRTFAITKARCWPGGYPLRRASSRIKRHAAHPASPTENAVLRRRCLRLLRSARNDEIAAGPKHACWSKEEVRRRAAGLVQIGVLRKSDPANCNIVLPRNRDFVDGTGECDQVLERSLRIPGRHPQETFFVIQHYVQDKPEPRAMRGFCDRFVKGIALDASKPRPRVIHKCRTVRIGDQFFARRSNRQCFLPPEYPPYWCGSTIPVAMTRSDSMTLRCAKTGTPPAVFSGSTRAAGFCGSLSITR